MRRAYVKRAALALAALALTACVTNQPRGRMAFLSTRAIDVPMRVVDPSIVSEGCPVGVPWDQLLERTLERAPGANAMVDAELKVGVEAVCQSVRGVAVQVGGKGSERLP
ncbi:MAG TPA: hypothetical protein VMW35_18695 [Myxococcota bacterium]|jgi:hypothetical protein|nr:hypothetical protein [Myxococcota bacterium]